MNWSFKVAQVSGINIRVHVTFFLILLLGAIQWGTPFGGEGALFGVVLMILLFTCVTLHELGHSLVAQRLGVPVREIVLLPLGGVALLGRNPSKPLHELLIAAAGPLVNVALAAVLLAATGTLTDPTGLDGRGLVRGELPAPSLATLLTWLLEANITLVLFNLIPAFPLDGGRILRALLAMRMGMPRATAVAAGVGQLIAIALGVFGVISGNFILVLVAVFVFFGAGQEQADGRATSVLATLRVGNAYNKHALTLAVGDRVGKIVDYMLTSYQPDFAVMQGNRLLGVVTREDVLRAVSAGRGDTYVTEVMRREVIRVDAAETLEQVRRTMGQNATRVVAVYTGGEFLGLISIEDIAEAFTIMASTGRSNPGQALSQS